jgi:hypothetical protein
MGLDSHSGVLRVREVLEERGFEPEVVELERTARSAPGGRGCPRPPGGSDSQVARLAGS